MDRLAALVVVVVVDNIHPLHGGVIYKTTNRHNFPWALERLSCNYARAWMIPKNLHNNNDDGQQLGIGPWTNDVVS